MPQRLPVPGADNDTWGDILNAYLQVSHNPDGTQADNTIGTPQLQDSAVTAMKLDGPTQSAVSKANASVQTINTKTPDASGNVVLSASDVSAIPTSDLGTANGIATLDNASMLTSSQLPGSVVSVSSSGTKGNVPVDQGNGTYLWGAQPAGGTGIGFGNVVAKTASYSIVSGDLGTVLTFNGANLTATLPSPAPAQPWTATIINLNTTALTVSPNGHTLNGASSGLLTVGSGQSATLFSDGSNYVYAGGVFLVDLSVLFNGASSYISVPYNPALTPSSSNAFTMEAWVNPVSLASYQNILTTYDGTNGVNLDIDGTGHVVLGTSSAYGSTGTIVAGSWTHVAMSYANGTATFYIAGSSAGTATPPAWSAGTKVQIGEEAGGSAQWFNGRLERVAFYSQALTATRIAAHANAVSVQEYDAAVLADGPTAYWGLQDVSGSVAVDRSANSYNGTYFSCTLNQLGRFI